MAKFNDSLSTGKKIEHEVCEIIKKKYPKAYVKDGYYKQADIIVPGKEILVEVKQDYQSHHTGNFLVEIEFDEKPSGLSTTEANWWVIVDRENLYWIYPGDLECIISELALKPVEFVGKGDKKSKKAYLLPKENLVYSMYALIMEREVKDIKDYKEE